MRILDVRLKSLGILLTWICVGMAIQPIQAAPQRKDEGPKFGNGALLRRIFGDGDKAKQTVEKAKNTQRDNLEATRQRFRSDSDKLKEKLGFKSTSDETESAKPASQPSRISDEAHPLYGTPFATQQPSRMAISDQYDARSTNARSTNQPPPVTILQASSGVGTNGTGQLAGTRPNPAAVSAFETAPRNQPRVPAQPTFASPGAALPMASPQNRTGSILEQVLEPANAPASYGAFGIIVESSAAVPGLLIKSIKPKSVAADAGLLPGDVIKNVAGLDVSFVEEIDSLVEVLEPEDEFEITFLRKGKSQTRSFSLPQ